MEALLALVPPYLPEAIGWAILHSIWQIGLAAGVVAFLLFGVRLVSPQLRYYVASAGLVAAAAMPIFSLVNHAPWKTEPTTTIKSPIRVEFEPSVAEAISSVAAQVEMARVDTSTFERLFEPALPWLFLLWMFGVLVRGSAVTVAAIGVVQLRREVVPKGGQWVEVMERLTKRLGIRQPVTLVESMTAEVPFVVGWLRPMVVIPTSAFAGIPPAHLEGIIAHELAHVRRNDYLINLLQVGVETIYFYHPGIWWMSEQIRIEREHCCDDLAADSCYGPLSYARALAQLEELRAMPVYAVAATGGSLLDRITRLTKQKRESGERGAAGITALLIGLAVILPIAAWVSAYPGQPDITSTTTVAADVLDVEVERALPAEDHEDHDHDHDRTWDRLRNVGIDKDDIEAFRRLGYVDYRILRRFGGLGIDPDDAQAYQKAGFGDGRDIVALARRGLSPEDLHAYTKAGLPGLEVKSLILLARYGVDANDAKELLRVMKLESIPADSESKHSSSGSWSSSLVSVSTRKTSKNFDSRASSFVSRRSSDSPATASTVTTSLNSASSPTMFRSKRSSTSRSTASTTTISRASGD